MCTIVCIILYMGVTCIFLARTTNSNRTPQKFFKRKDQLRLSEMWVSESVSDITECSLPSDTTFVLGWPGWPITNCVAAFSSPEERKLWFTLLSKYVVYLPIVSYGGLLNTASDFNLHGCLHGIEISNICMKAATF